jgi:hypothetical protein
VEAVERFMERTAELEREHESNIDVMAGLTGEMLGEIFCYREDEWSNDMRTMGFYMGKFIYLMDAYEDFDADMKKKEYNPLSALKYDSKKEFETLCRLLLTSMMSECAKSFERLPIILHADILRNILYSGVWSRYEYIQIKKNKKKHQKSQLQKAEKELR